MHVVLTGPKSWRAMRRLLINKMAMTFCDHCQGQRFDRAQVLRALRAARKRLRGSTDPCSAEEILALAIDAVRTLNIPHLEVLDDVVDGEVVH